MRFPSAAFTLALACVTVLACDHPAPTTPDDPLAMARLTPAAFSHAGSAGAFPEIIPLPTGFQPEGIAVGRGTRFFVGSTVSGAIYGGDLRTGAGSIVVPADPGNRALAGLAFDSRSDVVFAAGSTFGTGYAFDVASGATLAVYPFADPRLTPTFVNDVVVTREAAYFTDSFRPALYRVPLGPAGTLPDPADVQELSVTGEFTHVTSCPLPGAPPVNANGIVATPNGEDLIIVNFCLGTLYRVDPGTGSATLIDLGGAAVPFADGLLLDGRELYAVQNFLNQIPVIRLNRDLTAGAIARVLTDPHFRIPTTVAEHGSALYAVNARFDVAPPGTITPDLEFEVVRVPKR
jgi:hypothetical protein